MPSFTDTITLGNALGALGAVAAAYVLVKSRVGGAWKSIAEGYEKKADLAVSELKVSRQELKDATAKILSLTDEVATLRARPDLTEVSSVLAKLVSQMTQHEVNAAQRGERLVEAIDRLGTRDPTLRTRASDPPSAHRRRSGSG